MNKSDSYIEGEASQSGTRAVSVPSPLAAFQSAAWACAHTLLENIMYIQKELPTLDLAEAQRSAIVQICSTLVGTKHDVVSELFDLQDIEGAAESDVIQKRIERIVQMVIEDLTQLHEVVQSLETAIASDRRVGLAYLLVAESAANMLRSYVEMRDAADRYGKEIAKDAP
jgi:hypothetical protein